MNEVELIGYTGDLRFLVLELRANGQTRRLRLPVDPDLVATLDEIRDHRDDLPDLEWYAGTEDRASDRPQGSEAETTETTSPAPTVGDRSAPGRIPGTTASAPEEEEPSPTDPETPADEEGDDRDPPDAVAADGRPSTLTPAQIQTSLRSGRSVRSVAEAAGTDVAWVERWLPPIVAEREQVLREARRLRLTRARLGGSRRALGDAVERNLADRGVDDDTVTWTASRRTDGQWTVGVRYRHRGRVRSASWRFDRDAGRLSAASDLARELGWVRGTAAKKTAKKTAKKATAKRAQTTPERR